MTIKVLAIGDIGNIVKTIQKYVKKSEIYLINYPKDGAAVFTDPDGIELFKTRKVSEQVKRINEIKDNFDICLTTASERIAYLADINYIGCYWGRDIDVPMWKKILQKNGKLNRYTDLIFLREDFIGMHLKMQLLMLQEDGNLNIYQNTQKMGLIVLENQ